MILSSANVLEAIAESQNGRTTGMGTLPPVVAVSLIDRFRCILEST
jgi:hypothetical protein